MLWEIMAIVGIGGVLASLHKMNRTLGCIEGKLGSMLKVVDDHETRLRDLEVK